MATAITPTPTRPRSLCLVLSPRMGWRCTTIRGKNRSLCQRRHFEPNAAAALHQRHTSRLRWRPLWLDPGYQLLRRRPGHPLQRPADQIYQDVFARSQPQPELRVPARYRYSTAPSLPGTSRPLSVPIKPSAAARLRLTACITCRSAEIRCSPATSTALGEWDNRWLGDSAHVVVWQSGLPFSLSYSALRSLDSGRCTLPAERKRETR